MYLSFIFTYLLFNRFSLAYVRSLEVVNIRFNPRYIRLVKECSVKETFLQCTDEPAKQGIFSQIFPFPRKNRNSRKKLIALFSVPRLKCNQLPKTNSQFCKFITLQHFCITCRLLFNKLIS